MNIRDIVPSRFPTRRQLASALGVSTQAVYNWLGGEIPELRQYQIRALLDGRNKNSGAQGAVSVPPKGGEVAMAKKCKKKGKGKKMPGY